MHHDLVVDVVVAVAVVIILAADLALPVCLNIFELYRSVYGEPSSVGLHQKSLLHKAVENSPIDPALVESQRRSRAQYNTKLCNEAF